MNDESTIFTSLSLLSSNTDCERTSYFSSGVRGSSVEQTVLPLCGAGLVRRGPGGAEPAQLAIQWEERC